MQGHFIAIAIIFAGLADLVYTQCNGDYDVRARTNSGWVCGKIRPAEDNNTYASFRGIPYAEPPLGEYRYSELRPKVSWDGFFNATSEGPICPQDDNLYGKLVYSNRTMSEDCIRVNVHVPDDALSACGHEINTEAKLPILVFIHSGAFRTGSGDSDLYGPEYLVSKGVIVITFNYRLNVMGFLSLNSKEIPGNNGLRDIVTLLRYVKTNAKSFGGDPENVTLGGQSTGATLAHMLSLSDQVLGLFKRILMMSGTAMPSYFPVTPLYAQYCSNLFLTTLGINSTDYCYIHQKLIELPLSHIMEANKVVQLTTGVVSFTPVMNSYMLTGDPIALMKSGRGNEYSMMVGFTAAEAEVSKTLIYDLDMLARLEKSPEAMLPAKYNYAQMPTNLLLYLAKKMQDRYFNGTLTVEGYIKLLTDACFKYPAIALSKIREENGAPVYLYNYKYKADNNVVRDALDLDYEEAAHVEDMVLVFRANAMLGDTSFSPDSDDYYMKEWMTSTVVNFMTCSAPCCTNSSAWQPSVNQTYQVVDLPLVYASTPPTPEQCDMVAFYQQLDRDSCNATLAV